MTNESMLFNEEEVKCMVERALKDVFSTMLSMEITLKECITIIGGESARSPLSQCDGPLVNWECWFCRRSFWHGVHGYG